MTAIHTDLPEAHCRPHYMEMHQCPNCGDRLLAAEGSEHVNAQWVRYFWLCETCLYRFATSVRIAAR